MECVNQLIGLCGSHIRCVEKAARRCRDVLLCVRVVSFCRESEPLRRDAVYALIERYHLAIGYNLVIDGGQCRPRHIPADGEYLIPTNALGDLYATLEGDSIRLSSWYRQSASARSISDYLNLVCAPAPERNAAPLQYLMINSDCTNWDIITTRDPRDDITLETGSPAFCAAAAFVAGRVADPNCLTTGVLLHGPPNSGKTSLSGYVAQTHGFRVYNVKLNHLGLTDAALEALVAMVYENSVILFDEMDSSLRGAMAHEHVSVSPGGVLSALCGGIPRNRNTVVIVTTNNLDALQDLFPVPKTFVGRPGRIDGVFSFAAPDEELVPDATPARVA